MSAKLYKSNHQGAVSTIISDNLTEDIVVVSDSAGKIASSGISTTELSALSGVKSNVQTQLDDIAKSIPATTTVKDGVLIIS